MTIAEIMAELEGLGDAKVCRVAIREGAGENQFGVKLGDLRTLAKKLKTNHPLALELWQTGNLDAQLVGVLMLRPQELSVKEIDRMVKEATVIQLADWLNSYVVKNHPQKERLRQEWMMGGDPMTSRAAWSLTADLVAKSSGSLELSALLDRIDDEISTAPEPVQWTMNSTLAAIGIHHPEHRERALAIGEKHGIYRDYPVSKGCTSPFAPIWICEMVSRQG